MIEIAQNVLAIVCASLLIAFVWFVCVFVIMWAVKTNDKEVDYMKSLSETDKQVINNYKLNTRVPMRDVLKKGKKAHEDK